MPMPLPLRITTQISLAREGFVRHRRDRQGSCNRYSVMAYSYHPIPHHGDRDESDHELFRSIEFTESRQRSLWMSIAVHGVLLTALLLIPLMLTDAIRIRYDTVLLAPPPEPKQILEVTHYKQPPAPKPEKPLVAPPPVKPLLVKPPEVKPPEPKPAEVKIPEVIEREKPKPVVRNTPRLETIPPTV